MFEQSEDQQPWIHLRGYPLYATHVIVLAYVITMLICTILGQSGAEYLAAWLGFDSMLVHRGQIWRIFTYGLVNLPSIRFIIDMVVIVWFGRELEKYFGRKVFLRFYGSLYLLTPLVFTLLGLIQRMDLVGETGGLALFIGFATLYPGALMIFGIPAMWWAIGVLAIETLMLLFARNFIGMIAFWIPVAFAYAFVRYEQGRFELPTVRMPSFGKRPKLRVLPRPSPDADQEIDEPMAEVDALLDKIARSGIGSLSAKERERLEQARAELLRRESR